MLGLRKEFEFEDGVAVGNKNVTIVLFKGKPSPETLGHMSLHLPDMATLRKALAHLNKHDVDLEDPVMIWSGSPRLTPYGSCVFTISMAIAGNPGQCKGESDLMIRAWALCNSALRCR